AARAPFDVVDRDAAFAVARAAAAAAPAARFAIETGLLDALGRECGLSLAALLRALNPGAHVGAAPGVPLAAVVDDPASARRAFDAGIRCLKIKVDATEDFARVFLIAGAAPEARLRIDANQSWPPAEVAERLAVLA